MRVLIVGCGYVGIPLGAELARRGHDVFGLRRSASADDELHAAGIQRVVADVTKPETLAGVPAGLDWVVNCVASGGGSAEDYRRIYLQGTRNLLDRLATSPPQKLVYTGSTSVYGQTDGSRVNEGSPTEPAAPTARVLLETERLLLDSERQKNCPTVVLRVAGIYGPGRSHWLKQYLNGEARMDGTGDRILNMIHRDDVAGCIVAALENGRPGEIYNAVDDRPVSQAEFFQWLADTLGGPQPPRLAEPSDHRLRGATNKVVSNQKLKTELGYRFKYPDFSRGYGAELERMRRASDSIGLEPR